MVVASSTQAAYRQALQGHLVEWPIESSVVDKWNLLKSAIVKSAETNVRRARHPQPDWFLDSASTVEPARAHCNDLLPSLGRLQVSRRSITKLLLKPADTPV